eukprot:m.3190 g.3190  ORF g.3190 m.3190 type:complete len:95 (+) comp2027_c0_seq2:194-478(+)
MNKMKTSQLALQTDSPFCHVVLNYFTGLKNNYYFVFGTRGIQMREVDARIFLFHLMAAITAFAVWLKLLMEAASQARTILCTASIRFWALLMSI